MVKKKTDSDIMEQLGGIHDRELAPGGKSNTSDKNTRTLGPQIKELEIPYESDVMHLIRKGVLTQFHYDTEFTTLDDTHAGLLQWGHSIFSLGGQLQSGKEIDIKLSDRKIMSHAASRVTRIKASDAHKEDRVSLRETMARLLWDFEQSRLAPLDLPLQRETIRYRKIKKKAGKSNARYEAYYEPEELDANGKPKKKKEKAFEEEEVLLFPLKDDNGDIVYKVRLHPASGKLSYRYSKNQDDKDFEQFYQGSYKDVAVGDDGKILENDSHEWRFVSLNVQPLGYNNKRADNKVMVQAAVQAGMHPQNSYFLQSQSVLTNKQMTTRPMAVDGLTAAKGAALFGKQDEINKLNTGQKADGKNRSKFTSFSLGKIIEENTRSPDFMRGIPEGLLMPDGSLPNQEKAHGALNDTLWSGIVYNHIRRTNPNIVRDVELQSDKDRLKDFLNPLDVASRRPSIFAVASDNYPYGGTAIPYFFLNFDSQYGNFKKSISLRFDHMLRAYRNPDGKALHEMGPEDFVQLINDERNGGSKHKMIRMDKRNNMPAMAYVEDALNSPAAKSWDFEEIYTDNWNYLKQNVDIVPKIMAAVQYAHKQTREKPKRQNPVMEEEWPYNGFGEIDYLEMPKGNLDQFRAWELSQEKNERFHWRKVPGVIQPQGPIETLFHHAMVEYNRMNVVDELLHRLILHPHMIEFSDDPSVLENFEDLCKRIELRMDKIKTPYSYLFDAKYRKCSSAEDYRNWRSALRDKILIDHAKYRKANRRYRRGIFNTDFYDQGAKPPILFGNPTRNMRVVDRKGRHIPLSHICTLDSDIVYSKLDSSKGRKPEWKIEFYTLTSRPSVTATMFQYDDMGELDKMPKSFQKEYAALRKLYRRGRPNEDSANASIPGYEFNKRLSDRILQNAALSDEEDPSFRHAMHQLGDSDALGNHDEYQQIDADYSTYLNRIKREGDFKPTELELLQYDVDSRLDLDRIDIEVREENIVDIKVPSQHLRNPLSHGRFGPQTLVVRKLPKTVRDAVESGKKSIRVIEAETGRQRLVGKATVIKPPANQNTPALRPYFNQAAEDYDHSPSRMQFPKPADRDVLVIEGLWAPINSRDLDHDPKNIRSVRVPRLYFDALVCPELSHFKKGQYVTGLIIPKDYVFQKFEEGLTIRFRETLGSMNMKLKAEEEKGLETGEIYESTIKAVKKVKVKTVFNKVTNGEIDDAEARRYGFAGPEDMRDKLLSIFVDENSPNPMEEEVYMIDFDRVAKESWAKFDDRDRAKAGIIRNGKPISPIAHRNGLRQSVPA